MLGIATGPLGGFLHRAHASRGGLVGEEGVEDHLVEAPAAEVERVRTERHPTERDVVALDAVEVEVRPRTGRSVVTQDHLALPQTAQDADEVFDLGGGHVRQPHRVEHPVDATTETEREPAAGEAVHRGAERRRHRRVAGVVVGGRGGDGDVFAHRSDRAADRGGFLHVQALGDEHAPEAHRFGIGHFPNERARRRRCTGERVEPEFVEAWHRARHRLAGAAAAHVSRCSRTPSRIRSHRGRLSLIFMSNDVAPRNSRISMPSGPAWYA